MNNLKDIHNKDYSEVVNIQSGTQVSLFFSPKSLPLHQSTAELSNKLSLLLSIWQIVKSTPLKLLLFRVFICKIQKKVLLLCRESLAVSDMGTSPNQRGTVVHIFIRKYGCSVMCVSFPLAITSHFSIY